jgi:hypothetical protein
VLLSWPESKTNQVKPLTKGFLFCCFKVNALLHLVPADSNNLDVGSRNWLAVTIVTTHLKLCLRKIEAAKRQCQSGSSRWFIICYGLPLLSANGTIKE